MVRYSYDFDYFVVGHLAKLYSKEALKEYLGVAIEKILRYIRELLCVIEFYLSIWVRKKRYFV